MSTKTPTSKGPITPRKKIRDRPEQDQSPTIENAFSMLNHLAKSKPATVTEMGDAVRRRAKKKHSPKLR